LRILREKFIGISPNEWAPADMVFCAASYAEDFLGTLSGKGFQDILSRADAQNSGGFFPKLPEYSGIMKRLPKIWDILANAFKNKKHHGKFIIDSIQMKLCLQVRFKRFKTMQEAMGLAISSTKRVCGFKVHVVTDMRGKK
jgi:hypothetical protein